MRKILFRILGLSMSILVLAGCTGPRWGIRPDDPPYNVQKKDACQEFVDYANYTQDLKEAYHSRATQNRSWIFVSGTTALATVTTTAALAAASSASAGSLALVPIIGGFLSGVFAIADNPTLADIYTIAGNQLGTTLQKADEKLTTQNGNRYADPAACASALVFLRQGVTETKNNLERARTDSAVAALQRATAQTQHLNKIAAEIQAQAVIPPGQKGEIADIQPNEVPAGAAGENIEIKLTVSNVNLSSIGFGDAQLVIGDKNLKGASWTPPDAKTGNYVVIFKVPAKPPIDGKLDYTPTLLIKGLTKVECRPNVTLKYKKTTPG